MTSISLPIRAKKPMADKYTLKPSDFRFLQKLALDSAGVNLSKHKEMLVYNRLIKRVREMRLPDFHSYCELLQNDKAEIRVFLDAITTTTTSFFRANHQFEYFKNIFLREWFETNSASRQLSIWSAGCATGEEAYSIAISIFETLPEKHDRQISILATDINMEALEEAKKGIYTIDDIAHLGMKIKKKWFLKGIGKMAGYVKVKPILKKIITFDQLNLVSKWPSKKIFNIIFCRNVVIYFNKETQKILFDRFADSIVDQGLLIIGHAENLYNISDRFKHLGNNIYKKIR